MNLLFHDSSIHMFEMLNRIKDAWNNSKFIVINISNSTSPSSALVIPSQMVQTSHITRLRLEGGSTICVTMDDKICRDLEIPFLTNIQRGISARYPIIQMMSNTDLQGPSHPSISVSIDHKDAVNGLSDVDRALTISELAKLIDQYESNKISRKDLVKSFGFQFRLPGSISVMRASYGLMRKRKGLTEISIALCGISGQLRTTTFAKLVDPKTGTMMQAEEASKFAKKHDYPFVDSIQIIHLWRSINKIPKSEVLSD